MPFGQFQVLLRAGYGLRMQEHAMAITAASYPHMDQKGRAAVRQGLLRATEGEEAETDSGAATWGRMRDVVRLEAMRSPLTPAARAKLAAGHDAQSTRQKAKD